MNFKELELRIAIDDSLQEFDDYVLHYCSMVDVITWFSVRRNIRANTLRFIEEFKPDEKTLCELIDEFSGNVGTYDSYLDSVLSSVDSQTPENFEECYRCSFDCYGDRGWKTTEFEE